MNVMMNVIVDLHLLTVLSPFVSWFIYDLIHSSPLFIWYRNWLYKEEEELLEIPLFKYPLGYCLKCMSVWVSIIIFFIPIIKINLFIITVSISYFIIVRLFYE